MRQSIGQEIEIKLRVPDRRALMRRLARLHARPEHPRVHEMNTLYDTPEATLFSSGCLLRIRVMSPAPLAARPSKSSRRSVAGHTAWLTYKGPAPANPRPRNSRGTRYKIREEREVSIRDAEGTAAIVEALGYRPSFRYQKYRSAYRLPGLPGVQIAFDETSVGDFLEIEGSRSAIDRAATLLGFGPSDYITKSYGELLAEFRHS